MRIIYIDESYDKNVYTLCGAIIVDMKYGKFCRDFNKFLKHLCNLSEDDELKGELLFNGKGTFEDYSMKQRADIVLKIGKFLGNSSIKNFIVGYKIDYKDQEKTYLQILDFVISEAAKITSKAGKTSKQLMVVFDELGKRLNIKYMKNYRTKRRKQLKNIKVLVLCLIMDIVVFRETVECYK